MDFEEKRDRVLCALYAEVGEDGTKFVAGLADQLGLNCSEFMTVAIDLAREGYIHYRAATGGGAMAITGMGIRYAQEKCKK
ncbi:MAG TPA: hypothetical protein VEG44_00175 [Candidatus Acidoferrales bacterium]|nr:hypothetical protein [Candidatus Acidoferrales bacterium]